MHKYAFPFWTMIEEAEAFNRANTTKEPAIKRGVRVVALAELQETSDVACDTGSDVADLKREFSEYLLASGTPVVDFSLVPEDWTKKVPVLDLLRGVIYGADSRKPDRACAARRWLRQRPEKEIVVICHGGFLHYFTQDWSGIKAEEHASAWENCDFRTYQFVDSPDNEATMLETDESRHARGAADQKVPTKEEQQKLYLQAMQTWEDRGFQNPLKLNEQFS
uniref:Uncharacterized protein C5H10.03 n=1 Tax=Talaromyces marneffei PM1 TaxID=1077442 RepID=A0A093UVX5_TALMA